MTQPGSNQGIHSKSNNELAIASLSSAWAISTGTGIRPRKAPPRVRRPENLRRCERLSGRRK